MKYFQSLDNPNNKDFVAAFKKMWGEKTVIGDVTQAAYLGPWLWKFTVEKAGSFDVDKIAEASPGIEFTKAPEGYVKIHPNHHLWSKTRVGLAQPDGQFKGGVRDPGPDRADPFPRATSDRLTLPPGEGPPSPGLHAVDAKSALARPRGIPECSLTIRWPSLARFS